MLYLFHGCLFGGFLNAFSCEEFQCSPFFPLPFVLFWDLL